ncbi:DUF4148 domain-containing protein [Paracidovorax cattleyae]|uniref:DUF4148 domain-containing protein n=1 Tax=Paracidovorax cattleyae TaxID=80868 RepID=A0A1H0T8M9_9BURK|nr:DUF4148 domain-containing protein [Paracidovorax cattleyae]AVS75477.1 DUF4148 domain-containing protein [Paracidovorax cattleyae]MBF9267117.1 DUF4148 domain-containing protein [Paracidovorax cattleyae]SDP50402.1 protein of unknown function [Paracidovorax cattleyae]
MNRKPLAIAAALLALTAFSAQADTGIQGDWNNYPAVNDGPSTLTREAVIADLVAARQNGTMPRSGEWSDVPAPLAVSNGNTQVVTRDQVRAEAVAAARSHEIVSGDH